MTDAAKEPEQGALERMYAIACLVALLVVVILLMFEGMGVWSVLPMLVGGVAFLLRWRSGPPLVLFTFLWMAPTQVHAGYEPEPYLTALAGWSSPGLGARAWHGQPISVEDVFLCAALLTYTAACYRSLALAHSAFPSDLRRLRWLSPRDRKRPPAKLPEPLVQRPADPVSAMEVPVLFGALAAAVVAGLLLWYLSGFLPAELDLSPTVWHNALFFWLFVFVVALGLAFFRYQARGQAPAAENLLYLQDQLWQQTRHEQGALNRWLVWARLRWQQRKER